MNKKTMIIISIVISVISVIYLALCYFGIIRYIKLHLFSTESYAEPYVKTPRGKGGKNKIAINISTTDPDIEKLKPFINSIMDQSVHVDQIAINLPDGINFDIPKHMKDCEFISFYNLSKNYGDASKYIGPLLREKDGDSTIICLDEKTLYGTDYIESLLDFSNDHKDCVIYSKGYNARKFVNEGKIEGDLVDVVQFSGGVLFKPSMISPDILNTEKGPDESDCEVRFSSMIRAPLCKMDYDDNMQSKSSEDLELRSKTVAFFAAYLPSFSK